MSHTGVEAVSNLLTAGAYLVLAGLLVAFSLRPRLPFRVLFLLFAAFIASCAVTHLAHLDSRPVPWVHAWAAAISVFTAVVTAILWPRVWKLPETIAAWRGSEQVHLALAVEATRLGIWEYDVETGAVHCSESMVRILGHDPGTVLTTASIAAQVHPDDRAAREAALAGAVRQGEGAEYRMDYRITRPDGAVRWIESRGRVCTKLREGWRGVRLTGTLLDITERRETLDALQRSSHELEQRVAERTGEVRAANARLLESEQRFRSAFDDSAIGMALVGLDGQWLQVNRAICDIVGYPADLLATKTFQDITHPDDIAPDLELVRQLLSGAIGSYNLEKRYIRADGSTTWVMLTATLVRDAAGEPLHFLSQIQDIDARKRAEAERDRVFTAARDMLFSAGLDGYFRRLNPAFPSTLGWTEQQLCARPFMEFVHPDDLEATREGLDRMLGSGDSVQFTNRYRCGDGSYRWLEWHASAPDGNAIIYGGARDVTERRRAQEALEEAKEAAEAASRAKSEFLARMSHELRTPLNAIIGFSDLMLSGTAGEVTEVQGELLEPVLRNGRHLLGLIEDILDLSKIEAGRSDIEMGPVDACRILEQLVLDFEPQLRGRPVRLETDLPSWGRPDPVWADPIRLRQVVLNLVSNAVKFTREGRVTMRLVGDAATREARWIEVEDTGIGIPSDRRAAIFDAFEQAQSHTAREYGGTGLGLTISRRLCEQMGCTIDVTSEVGRGSVFRVTFPPGKPQVAATT